MRVYDTHIKSWQANETWPKWIPYFQTYILSIPPLIWVTTIPTPCDPMDIVRARAPDPIGHGNALTENVRHHDLATRN